ncbi:hypothetical protein PR048_030291 [Dryococelus australis]|uniref:Uncharacterized protein n=1 Tax=Dryococelus australis TaxID=614101 RepID=A0ABQ9GB70_9NEOP|nr:hypothetical protein PR048_030291 [Dryococelus australis]
MSKVEVETSTFGWVSSRRVTSPNTEHAILTPMRICTSKYRTSGIWKHALPNLTSHLMKYYVKHITQRLLHEMTKTSHSQQQILINPSQADLQRILWCDDLNSEIKIYKLKTVTYGTTSAPFMAIRTLRQLASNEEHDFPKAAIMSCTWKTFIANRVSEIQELIQNMEWGHVSIADSHAGHHADRISIGVGPQQLAAVTGWWHGPR